jgi:hypothetical protein
VTHPGPLLVAQLASTLPLVGLIWFVQVVAYPLFALVDPAHFEQYHQAHSAWITWLVGPLMLVELAAAGLWVLAPDPNVPRWLPLVGLALVVLAWLVTVFLSVPQHNILAGGFDGQAHRVLVATNWLRTLAWTARAALLLGLVWRG